MISKNKKRVSITLPRVLEKKLAQRAADHGISLSQEITRTLSEVEKRLKKY